MARARRGRAAAAAVYGMQGAGKACRILQIQSPHEQGSPLRGDDGIGSGRYHAAPALHLHLAAMQPDARMAEEWRLPLIPDLLP